MRRRIYLLIPALFPCLSLIAQSLNLDFEEPITQEIWHSSQAPWTVNRDSTYAFSGQYSLNLMCTNPPKEEYGSVSCFLPNHLGAGHHVEIRAKMSARTSGPESAALLWCSAFRDQDVVSHDQMVHISSTGEEGWSELVVAMEPPLEVSFIAFGISLVGAGQVWADHFQIFVDGELLSDEANSSDLPSDSERAWLKTHVVVLESVDPEYQDGNDLDALGKMIGDASVVGLGEATHGTREHFMMKDRIMRYLMAQKGFNIFSIEANMPESYHMNQYILEGEGSPAEYLKGMYFWTWPTEEVREMVEWMKSYHSESGRPIQFTGFDMQYYEIALSEVVAIVDDASVPGIADLKQDLDNLKKQTAQSGSYTHDLSEDESRDFQRKVDEIRRVLRKLRLDENKKSWALQNLRIVEQYLDKSNWMRDQYMAENLLWIKRQNPDENIIAWAHNEHIRASQYKMGYRLRQELKDDYVSIGFAFYDGSYTAKGPDGLTVYAAETPEPGSWEYALNLIDVPVFALDLRTLDPDDPACTWFLHSHLFRNVGALKRDNEFSPTYLADDFDILIFIRDSHATELLH